MENCNYPSFKKKWSIALNSNRYRKLLYGGIGSIIVILNVFPWFFQKIEARNGTVLNDWLLQQIPAHNVSLAIFICIWTSALFFTARAIQNPQILITFLVAYVLLCLSRIISITLVPLDAPVGLITLIDPLSNAFYGVSFITKDLFFSGHLSTVFLMGLCLVNKREKNIVFMATSIIAILLLIQHIHYTIDLLAAPFITFFLWRLAKKIAQE
ncbi:phosphatase PAP2-related protein [Flavobacterium sp. GB2R13]|uniref:phosphatase PAP2-related protein n=1 Tax=Flavobacterium algoris TaxID=3398733 RepID=UPI003A87573D